MLQSRGSWKKSTEEHWALEVKGIVCSKERTTLGPSV